MTKEQLKEELKEVKELYAVSLNRDETKFCVYYIKDGKPTLLWINAEEKDTPNYWVPLHYTKHGNYIGSYFWTPIYGTNRIFEIVYSIGMWLFNDGYRFKGYRL
jgi:hypothetical protein